MQMHIKQNCKQVFYIYSNVVKAEEKVQAGIYGSLSSKNKSLN